MSTQLVRANEVSDYTKQLTKQQRRFAEEYIIDLNGRKAAIRAGYAERSAQVSASHLMNNVAVSKYIDFLLTERSIRTGIDADMVLRELTAIALSNIINYEFDEEGFVKLREGAPDLALNAIKGIRRRVRYDDDGNKMVETELQLWDKVSALRMLGQHLKLFIQRHEITGKDGGPIVTEQRWKFGDQEIKF